MQNNNKDCRPISKVRGVGDGTCVYNSICTRGVGDGRGNNLCYTPPTTDKIDTFTSNKNKLNIENKLNRGMNVTFMVNIVLVILILLILYKIYNPSFFLF
jgi:hypothetical protein